MRFCCRDSSIVSAPDEYHVFRTCSGLLESGRTSEVISGVPFHCDRVMMSR